MGVGGGGGGVWLQRVIIGLVDSLALKRRLAITWIKDY